MGESSGARIPGMTKKALAEIAGYSYRQLHNIDTALPKDRKLFVESEDATAKAPRYDLALFVQRWVRFREEASGAAASDDLETVKAKHEAVKMQVTQMKVAQLQREYINAQEVERLWANIAVTVRGRFVTMARKLAPALVMQESPDVIERIIDREVRDTLSLLAETPLPSATEEDTESAGEDDEEA